MESIGGAERLIVRLAGTRVKRALPVIPSLYVASGSWHVVMVPILSVVGCFMRANRGCQTPCLVISARG